MKKPKTYTMKKITNTYKNPEFLKMHKQSQQLIDKLYREFLQEVEHDKKAHYLHI